jgi:hypothetical protein
MGKLFKTFSWAGGGMMLISVAYNIINLIYPFTNYNFISQDTARILFWVSIALATLGLAFIIIAIARYYSSNRQGKIKSSGTYNIDRLPQLLTELDKHVTESKDKAVQYNWVKKEPKDLTEATRMIVDAKGIVKYKDWDKWQKETQKKTIGRRKRIRGRSEVINIFEEVMSLLLTAEWKKEDLEIVSNIMDGTDLGIKKFKERNKKYSQTHDAIFRIEDVNKDKKLNNLVYKYILCSYTTSNFIDLVESLLKWVGYDYLPPEFVSSGASDPYLTINAVKSDILIQINQRIKEIKNGKVIGLKRLAVSIERQTGGGQIRILLKVRNDNTETIKRCYGQLLAFSSNDEKDTQIAFPPSGLYYAWASYGSSTSKEADIAGNGGFEMLDILSVNWSNNEYKNKLFTPVLLANGYNRQEQYGLPPGNYVAEVQIGSKSEIIQPEKITLDISYLGGSNIKITSITE